MLLIAYRWSGEDQVLTLGDRPLQFLFDDLLQLRDVLSDLLNLTPLGLEERHHIFDEPVPDDSQDRVHKSTRRQPKVRTDQLRAPNSEDGDKPKFHEDSHTWEGSTTGKPKAEGLTMARSHARKKHEEQGGHEEVSRCPPRLPLLGLFCCLRLEVLKPGLKPGV